MDLSSFAFVLTIGASIKNIDRIPELSRQSMTSVCVVRVLDKLKYYGGIGNNAENIFAAATL